MNSNTVTALIPARGGSKGIPRKNLLAIGDYPLIAYSIAAARLCPLIDEVIVSTDDEEIAEVARKYGAEVPFLRPAEIAKDHSTDKEFFYHFYEFLDQQKSFIPELVVQLRPTTPFRKFKDIENAIRVMNASDEFTSLRSMQLTSQTPYKLFYREDDLAAPILRLDDTLESCNLPRQHFPQVYQPNGVVDIVRPDILLKTDLLHGDKMYLFEVEPCPDIDDLQDLQNARCVAGGDEYRPLFKYLETIDK